MPPPDAGMGRGVSETQERRDPWDLVAAAKPEPGQWRVPCRPLREGFKNNGYFSGGFRLDLVVPRVRVGDRPSRFLAPALIS